MDDPKIIIEDRVKNIGSIKSPIMILYHFNIGYQIIYEDSKLIETKAHVFTRDEISKKGFDNYANFVPPTSGYDNELYLHEINPDDAGYGNIAIINKNFNNGEGIGIWLKYKQDTLPYLTQWKLLSKGGEYVCGLEPGNNLITSKEEARRQGTLNYLLPDEEKCFKLEFAILTNNKDINDFKSKFLK